MQCHAIAEQIASDKEEFPWVAATFRGVYGGKATVVAQKLILCYKLARPKSVETVLSFPHCWTYMPMSTWAYSLVF